MLLINKMRGLPFLCKEISTLMLQWETTRSVRVYKVYSVVILATCGGQKQLRLFMILYFNA
jgi:hypothetical protein